MYTRKLITRCMDVVGCGRTALTIDHSAPFTLYRVLTLGSGLILHCRFMDICTSMIQTILIAQIKGAKMQFIEIVTKHKIIFWRFVNQIFFLFI